MTRARTLADMISDGVIGTTELADDAITPVKLDETGNYQVAQLGVGGAASKKLTVQASGTYDGALISNAHASSAARLQLDNNNSKSLQIDVGGSTTSAYGPYNADTVSIVANSAPLNIGTDSANKIGFWTNLTQRMTIDTNGNIGFNGVTSPATTLDLGDGWMRGYGMYLEDHDGTKDHQFRVYVYGDSFAVSRHTASSGTGTYEDELMKIHSSGNVTFNDSGVDADFRVESDNSTHMLFVDASNNSIGINTSSVYNNAQTVAVGNTKAEFNATQWSSFSGAQDGSGMFAQNLYRWHDGSTTRTSYTNTHGSIGGAGVLVGSGWNTGKLVATNTAGTAGAEATNLKTQLTWQTDQVIVNDDGDANIDFRVESDNNSNMLLVDAGTDCVSIGSSSPNTDVSLHVDTEGSATKMRVGGLVAANNGLDSNIRIQGRQTGGTNVYADIGIDPDAQYLVLSDPGVSSSNIGGFPTRIDSEGRVSIANAQFTRRLNIAGLDPSNPYDSNMITIGIKGVNNSVNGGIDFCRADGISKAAVRTVNYGAYSKKGLAFYTNAASDYTTEATERLRITEIGNLQSTDYTSNSGNTNGYIIRQSPSSANTSALFESVTSAGAGRYHFAFRSQASSGVSSGGIVGSIYTTGSSTSYNTTSDYRLKENVTTISDGITRLKQLEPKRFNFISDPDTTVDGFLAHEAQAVVPEAVTGVHDGMREEEYEVSPEVLDDEGNLVSEAVMGTRSVPDYQGIDQAKLVPLLTAALQEAITKIETLETQRADMEARLTALEGA